MIKPENATIMHDARKLVENFYKPTKPYRGNDYERLLVVSH
jgi:hypothetical protein